MLLLGKTQKKHKRHDKMVKLVKYYVMIDQISHHFCTGTDIPSVAKSPKSHSPIWFFFSNCRM